MTEVIKKKKQTFRRKIIPVNSIFSGEMNSMPKLAFRMKGCENEKEKKTHQVDSMQR